MLFEMTASTRTRRKGALVSFVFPKLDFKELEKKYIFDLDES
jgi:hypothetical protein